MRRRPPCTSTPNSSWPRRPLPEGGLRVIPLGGLGEIGRNMTVFEHAGQAAHHRLRRALPRGPPARRRPDPARLHLHRGPARTTSSPWCSPTATRTTSGPCRTCCGCASDIPLDRLPADARPGRGQAQEHRLTALTLGGQRRTASASGRSTSSSSPSTTPSPTPSRSSSAPRPGTVAAHRRLQDGPAAAGRAHHRPARLRPARRGGRRPLHGRLDQRRRARASPTSEQEIAPVLDRVFAGANGGSSSRRSPPTCTASSRCSTRRWRTGARSPSSGGRWSATWASRDGPRLPDRPGRGARRRSRPSSDLPDDRGRPHVHGVAGRADGGAVAGSPTATTRSGSGRGDTVVLASSLIPGNENAVYRVINGLTRLGRRRGAPGQRPGARVRPRQRRRAALLLQHRPSHAT